MTNDATKYRWNLAHCCSGLDCQAWMMDLRGSERRGSRLEGGSLQAANKQTNMISHPIHRQQFFCISGFSPRSRGKTDHNGQIETPCARRTLSYMR